MQEEVKRQKIRNYFKLFPKSAIWMLLIGCLLLVIGISEGAKLLATGLLLACFGTIWIIRYLNGKATDQEMDQFFQEDLAMLTKHGLNKLGLEDSELVGNTVYITGLARVRCGAEFLYKVGKDHKLRFTPTQVTLIFFTQHQLVTYSCVFDSTTGRALNESTEEYFYQDVVSVSTRSTSVEIDLGKRGTVQAKEAEEFTLTTSGGTSISVVLRDRQLIKALGGGELPTTAAEEAIQSVRRMLRDKKSRIA